MLRATHNTLFSGVRSKIRQFICILLMYSFPHLHRLKINDLSLRITICLHNLTAIHWKQLLLRT